MASQGASSQADEPSLGERPDDMGAGPCVNSVCDRLDSFKVCNTYKTIVPDCSVLESRGVTQEQWTALMLPLGRELSSLASEYSLNAFCCICHGTQEYLPKGTSFEDHVVSNEHRLEVFAMLGTRRVSAVRDSFMQNYRLLSATGTKGLAEIDWLHGKLRLCRVSPLPISETSSQAGSVGGSTQISGSDGTHSGSVVDAGATKKAAEPPEPLRSARGSVASPSGAVSTGNDGGRNDAVAASEVAASVPAPDSSLPGSCDDDAECRRRMSSRSASSISVGGVAASPSALVDKAAPAATGAFSSSSVPIGAASGYDAANDDNGAEDANGQGIPDVSTCDGATYHLMVMHRLAALETDLLTVLNTADSEILRVTKQNAKAAGFPESYKNGGLEVWNRWMSAHDYSKDVATAQVPAFYQEVAECRGSPVYSQHAMTWDGCLRLLAEPEASIRERSSRMLSLYQGAFVDIANMVAPVSNPGSLCCACNAAMEEGDNNSWSGGDVGDEAARTEVASVTGESIQIPASQEGFEVLSTPEVLDVARVLADAPMDALLNALEKRLGYKFTATPVPETAKGRWYFFEEEHYNKTPKSGSNGDNVSVEGGNINIGPTGLSCDPMSSDNDDIVVP